MATSVIPKSSGSSHQTRRRVNRYQSQANSRLWCSSHSWSESLSRVSKAARLALAVVFEAVLPDSQSLGWCRVHMPAPSLWLRHQKYFLPSKVFTKALFSLLSVSLGGLPFHAHLSPDFFFCSLVFLAGAFLAACFLPAGFSFFVLMSHLAAPSLKS